MEPKNSAAAAKKAPAKAKAAPKVPIAKDAAQADLEPVAPIEGSADPKPSEVAETQNAASENLKAEVKTPSKDAYKELVAQYASMYPQCKAFHITTDMQVFLDGNLSDAFNHQRGLGGGIVKTLTPSK